MFEKQKFNRAAKAFQKSQVELIIESFKEENNELRAAAWAMAGGDRSHYVVPLAKRLGARDKEVRKAAVRALEDTRDKSAIEFLKKALKDRNDEVRSLAANAIKALEN